MFSMILPCAARQACRRSRVQLSPIFTTYSHCLTTSSDCQPSSVSESTEVANNFRRTPEKVASVETTTLVRKYGSRPYIQSGDDSIPRPSFIRDAAHKFTHQGFRRSLDHDQDNKVEEKIAYLERLKSQLKTGNSLRRSLHDHNRMIVSILKDSWAMDRELSEWVTESRIRDKLYESTNELHTQIRAMKKTIKDTEERIESLRRSSQRSVQSTEKTLERFSPLYMFDKPALANTEDRFLYRLDATRKDDDWKPSSDGGVRQVRPLPRLEVFNYH